MNDRARNGGVLKDGGVWLDGAVFLTWLVAFGWLWGSGEYRTFLAPNFWWLLAAGIMVLVAFLWSACLRRGSAPRPATLSRTLHGAVLILPLLYMQLAQGRTLGSSAMETRVVGMVDMSALSAALEGETQTDDEVEPTTTPVVDIMNLDGAGEAWFDEEAGEDGKAIIDDTTPTVGPTSRSVALEGEVTLLDILDNTNKMIDERLVTRGMVYRVDGVPDGYFLLFRFKITCCVADAEPLWILVGHKDADQFASDQWLRVEGTLRTREVEGEPMALIEATSITEIEEPKDVYLY